MLAQNRTLRRHALGRFPDAARGRHARPGDAAVPVARELRQGGAERELRARADGAVHARPRLQRARHPPGRARADRLPRRLARRRQRAHVLRPRVPRRRRASASSASAAASTGKDVLELCVHHPGHAPFLVEQAVGLLRRRAAAGRDPRAAGAHLPPLGAAHPAGRGRDPRPPRAVPRTSTRPTMVKSPRRVRGRARCARPARAIDRDVVDLAARGDGPVPVPPAVGRGLGLGRRAGCRRTPCACASTSPTTCSTPPRVRREGRLHPDQAVARKRAVARARRAVGEPVDLARAPTRELLRMARRAARPSRATAQPPASARTCASACCATCCSPAPTPRCTDERPPRLRRLPPQLRGRAPRLPRRPAAHAPPGARARGSAAGSRSTWRRRCRSSACSRRPRPTPPPRRTRRCWSRCSCPAASTCSTRSCRCTTTAATPTCAPTSRCEGAAARRAPASASTPSLARGTGGGIKGLFERGKIGFLPGIDYANPDLSHFHSRHFWETGLITDRAAPGWLGRWLDRAGGRDNPLQGISMGYGLSPVMRAGRAPVAAVASPGDAGFWIRDVWGDAFDEAMAAYGADRQRARRRARAAAPRARRRGWPSRWRTGSTPYAEHDGVDPLASSVAYPEDSDFGRAPALPGRDDLAAARHPRGGRAGRRRLRHPRRPGRADGTLLRRRERVPVGVPGRPRGARRRRPRADVRVVGVRPPAGAERRPAPTTAPAASPGCRATARAPGVHSDYPDLSRLDRDDNLQVTIDFRRVYSSLLEQRLGTDAGAVIPRAGRLRPRAAGRMRRLAARLPGRLLAAAAPRAPEPPRSASASASGASRSTAAACPVGVVRFNVRNFGEDGHDLAVRTRAGPRAGRSRRAAPGRSGDARGAPAQAGPLRRLLLAGGPRGARDARGAARQGRAKR